MSIKLRYLYRAYRYRWRVDPAEILFVRQQLRPGQVAVDIGGHKGAYSYWMRRSVGNTGLVHVFEPQPQQHGYLDRVFSAMGYKNVINIHSAVSDRCGTMALHVPHGKGSTHAASLEKRLALGSSSIEVPVVSLDHYFNNELSSAAPKWPNFIKIDVEGHEMAVLQGATTILEQHHPTILVECEARHRPDGDVRPVFEFLQSRGYEGSFFLNTARRPLHDFNPAIHQRINPSTPASLPREYVNNFAFVRP